MKKFVPAKIICGILIMVVAVEAIAILLLSICTNSPTDILSISIAVISAVLAEYSGLG